MNLKDIFKNQQTVKIVISVLIIAFLLKFINMPLLINSLKAVNNLFIVVLALIPVNILLRALRLMIILNEDEKRITFLDSFYLNLAGITLNLFMPASSGDVAKSYYGYKWHGIKEEMLSANIFDKFMALFSIFIIGSLAALALKFYALSIFSGILALFLALIFIYPHIMPWNSLNKVIFKFLKISLDENKLASSFEISSGIKIKAFLISIFAFIVLYFQFYLLCKSFYIDVTFFYVLAVAPLMNLALMFPLTLNGLGSGEAMIVYLFSLINISPTLTIIVSLLSQVINAIIPGLIGYLIILKR